MREERSTLRFTSELIILSSVITGFLLWTEFSPGMLIVELLSRSLLESKGGMLRPSVHSVCCPCLPYSYSAVITASAQNLSCHCPVTNKWHRLTC